MYLKAQLDRFAAQIDDAQKSAEFSNVISLINFENGLCVGSALDAFAGTSVNDLRREFERRHLEFLTQADLEEISGQR